MPRTKVPKKSSSKRNRDEQSQDELQLFEEEAAMQLARMDLEHNNCMQRIEDYFDKMRKATPVNVLNMTMRELAETGALLLSDASKVVDTNQSEVTNALSVANSTGHRHGNHSKEDEGYLTEAGTSASAASACGSSGGGNTHSVIKGPLASARGKQLRRSKSASSVLQSAPRAPLPSRLKTPATAGQHTSRSAYRTPLPQHQRIKSASADRLGNITPKVPVDKPVALLRFPKTGETLISLTGSPVAGGVSGSCEASVNIPTATGAVLSLRPTPSATFDSEMVGGIDESTMGHLKTLQDNIAAIMKLHQEANKK